MSFNTALKRNLPQTGGQVTIPGGFNQGGGPVLGGNAPLQGPGVVPPTGLIGGEQALLGGLQGALGAAGQGFGQA